MTEPPRSGQTAFALVGSALVIAASLLFRVAVLLDARICESTCGPTPGPTAELLLTVLVPAVAVVVAAFVIARRRTWGLGRQATALGGAVLLLAVAWTVAQARYPGEVNALRPGTTAAATPAASRTPA